MHRGYLKKGLVIIGIAAFIAACSPQSSYKTLSVFFDGVPKPNPADSATLADSAGRLNKQTVQYAEPQIAQMVVHPPYLDKNCEACHDLNVMGRFQEPMPALCYQCHENFEDKFAVLHGPVSSGFCTECHNPHMNENKKLLVLKEPELCLKCHNAEDVLKNDVHAGIEEYNCTECHNPHGGENRYIFN